MTMSPLNALVAWLESVEALDGPARTVRGLIPSDAGHVLLAPRRKALGHQGPQGPHPRPALKFGRCFYRAPEALIQQRVELRWDRDRVWIEHRGHNVVSYARSYEHGIWLPPPRMRPEPPPVVELIAPPGPELVPPALSD
jgi:hypothetical protein